MNIRPWEHELMTVEQFDDACRDVDDYLEALAAAANSTT